VQQGKFRETVSKDFDQGNQIGVNATPTFYINGRFLSGAQPFDAFKAIIDDELQD
jgi:protein-disulfide isomerase